MSAHQVVHRKFLQRCVPFRSRFPRSPTSWRRALSAADLSPASLPRFELSAYTLPQLSCSPPPSCPPESRRRRRRRTVSRQHRPRPPQTATMEYSIRAANVEDCKDIARMIGELAEYEKISDQVKITQRDLEQDGFSKNPFFHGIIAEVPEQHRTKEGHTKIGYALYFYSYSSWTGRAVYMEDLYVMPEFRGKGIGKALMSKVAQLGLAAGCNQLNFTVLDWNKSSLDFYFNQGCIDITANMGYHVMSCKGEALQHLAQP